MLLASFCVSGAAQAESDAVRAFSLIKDGDWEEAQEVMAGVKDPLAARLYHWLVFTRAPKSVWQDTKFVRLVQFIRDNPDWPDQGGMRLTAEQIMPDDLPDRDVVAWFDDYSPMTTDGIERYMQALLGTGQRDKAQKFISGWWGRTLLLKRDEQKEVYRKYGGLLGADDHKRRLDRLLSGGHYSNARAVADLLGADYVALTNAKIALAEDEGNVNALIARVPASMKDDPGLKYERLRWRRRQGLNDGAIEILNQAPPMDQVDNASSWWTERHIIARRFLEEGRYKEAYDLVRAHKQLKGLPYVQAEWMTGWLALRFMEQPTEAYQRFEALYSNVTTPISRSRAAYWAGRAAEAMGANSIAKAWYRRAAEHQTAYYGQMAVAELGLENELPNVAPPEVTAEEIEAFEATDFLKITHVLHDAGLRDEASTFLRAFVRLENTAKAYKYGADLATSIDHHHDSIQIAKDATKKGMFLTARSYPVLTDKMTSDAVEWALLHAIMRQESRFDIAAKSRAGALGLMQLMPATAKEVARKGGFSHRKDWLTERPDHNIRLGSLYLDELLNRYAGSYVLAIAAYNAGPGRVDRWLVTYGDPRTKDIDLIDWIELIPIYETRNYVQRVLEGVYVYRLRLNNIQKPPAHSIHIDLPDSL